MTILDAPYAASSATGATSESITASTSAPASAPATFTITVNGDPVDLPPEVTRLAVVLARYAPSRTPGADPVGTDVGGTDVVGTGLGADPGAPLGVAAAVNDRVVPRGAWTTTVLRAGDRVEIVTAVQGG